MSQAYEQMLREIVRDQGEPRHFDPERVELTDAQLATVLREDADVLVETAGEMVKDVAAILDGRTPIDPLFSSTREYLGFLFVAAMKSRAERSIRNDLRCKADDMAQEDTDEDAYARGAA